MRMRQLQWPADPELGETFYTIGLIEGGVAPNVISPRATAEVMFRIVGSPDDVLRQAKTLEPDVTIEEVLRVPMVRLHTDPRHPVGRIPVHHRHSAPGQAGEPRCCSGRARSSSRTPTGSISTLAELDAAVDGYAKLLTACLSSPASS